jgi:hypothetical protein
MQHIHANAAYTRVHYCVCVRVYMLHYCASTLPKAWELIRGEPQSYAPNSKHYMIYTMKYLRRTAPVAWELVIEEPKPQHMIPELSSEDVVKGDGGAGRANADGGSSGSGLGQGGAGAARAAGATGAGAAEEHVKMSVRERLAITRAIFWRGVGAGGEKAKLPVTKVEVKREEEEEEARERERLAQVGCALNVRKILHRSRIVIFFKKKRGTLHVWCIYLVCNIYIFVCLSVCVRVCVCARARARVSCLRMCTGFATDCLHASSSGACAYKVYLERENLCTCMHFVSERERETHTKYTHLVFICIACSLCVFLCVGERERER